MNSMQVKNPLHGITLEKILNDLVRWYGWENLGQEIKINCFLYKPSLGSSLKFLRRAPQFRKKVEKFYLLVLKEQQKKRN